MVGAFYVFTFQQVCLHGNRWFTKNNRTLFVLKERTPLQYAWVQPVEPDRQFFNQLTTKCDGKQLHAPTGSKLRTCQHTPAAFQCRCIGEFVNMRGDDDQDCCMDDSDCCESDGNGDCYTDLGYWQCGVCQRDFAKKTA